MRRTILANREQTVCQAHALLPAQTNRSRPAVVTTTVALAGEVGEFPHHTVRLIAIDIQTHRFSPSFLAVMPFYVSTAPPRGCEAASEAVDCHVLSACAHVLDICR
jgi:hypothetical protein